MEISFSINTAKIRKILRELLNEVVIDEPMAKDILMNACRVRMIFKEN